MAYPASSNMFLATGGTARSSSRSPYVGRTIGAAFSRLLKPCRGTCRTTRCSPRLWPRRERPDSARYEVASTVATACTSSTPGSIVPIVAAASESALPSSCDLRTRALVRQASAGGRDDGRGRWWRRRSTSCRVPAGRGPICSCSTRPQTARVHLSTRARRRHCFDCSWLPTSSAAHQRRVGTSRSPVSFELGARPIPSRS